jgi:hypothetical protein
MSEAKSLKEAEINGKPLTKQEIYAIIRSYIEDQIATAQRKQLSETNFDKPAWGEFQAYQIGFIKGLQKVLETIPLTKGNN